jgi:gliding motility-associated-like protein
MNIKNRLIYLTLFCLFNWTLLHSQTGSSNNLGFESGNFKNWVGYTWRYSQLVPSINTSPVAGIVNRRHTIMSDTSAYDANTGNALRKIPKGYRYSARLGDEITTSDISPRCWQQSLRYSITIDSSNALIIFKFALVLQYAIDHNAINEPRFKLTIYDNKGNVLPDCSNYDVFSSNKNVKGFKTYTPAGSKDPVEWRDWTTVGANLLKYYGQTVTIEFMATDCTQRFHYGYAYFVADCLPLIIKVKYCSSDTLAKLIAPEGFEKYSWTINNIVLDTVQTLMVPAPDQKKSYTCTMTSATGCVVSLQSSIVKYIPHADFSSFMLDCFSNTVQFINLSTTNQGTLQYNWQFESGRISSLKSPAFSFSTSGMHQVTLILSNSPSVCQDTLKRNVESFSPPLVGITGDSTYCPGLTTFIKAYGAVDYTWNNGSKKDSIEIGNPGGKFWLVGRSSTGCISDTIYKTIIEEPNWILSKQGDTIICGKGNVTLSALGANNYTWNNGNKNDSITVSSAGKYSVIGVNARGCKKTEIFNVYVLQLPSVDFSITPAILDSKNNTGTFSILAVPGVNYFWDTGDGVYGSGTSYVHSYNIKNRILFYKVNLIATDKYNCSDSSWKYIDVSPFIPNVFTPDGDGINDIFMPGFRVEIIDRNGLRIYKGENGWDGSNNGRQEDPGTYFYLVYYKDSNETEHFRKGSLTLVR